jgi:hypothetical protein
MIYQFQCEECQLVTELDAKAFHPPSAPACDCGEEMLRVYGCQIDTSGCKDHDHIEHGSRVQYGGESNISNGQATRIEAAHQKHNDKTRKDLAAGGNRGGIRKTMQIPATLFHGKIKETGDRQYWDDPKNRNRHNSCKVD